MLAATARLSVTTKSSDGSWVRMLRSSSWRARLGSMPSSSTSARRALWYAASASACRPAAVEREHLRAADPLAQRMLLCERCELAHELRMASYRQVGFDAFFQRAEAQLIEARDRRLREGVVGEVGKRGAAPQAECFPQRGRGSGRLGVRGFFAQPFEAVEVELSWLQPQFVAGGSRHDRVGSEAAPQLRDIDVQALGRGRRSVRPPQMSSISRSVATTSFAWISRTPSAARAFPCASATAPSSPTTSRGPRTRKSSRPFTHARPHASASRLLGACKATTRTQRAARAAFTAPGLRASAS